MRRTDYSCAEPTADSPAGGGYGRWSRIVTGRGPFDGIEFVLIDGNNLLHRRRQGTDDAALRGLLVELQRKLASGVRAEVILDGHPAAGTPLRYKVSSALELRHAGGNADDAIVASVAALPWAGRGRTIVVTDDRALADRCRAAGALLRRLDWIEALPAAPTNPTSRPGSSIGAGRRPQHRRPNQRNRGA